MVFAYYLYCVYLRVKNGYKNLNPVFTYLRIQSSIYIYNICRYHQLRTIIDKIYLDTTFLVIINLNLN